MATIEERKSSAGIRYRALVRKKGFPSQSATFSKKTDAKRWAREVEGAMDAGKFFASSEAKKRSLKDAIDRYKASFPGKNTTHLSYWEKELGSLKLLDITPSKISEKRDNLLLEETHRGRRSNATVVRYLASLSHLFSIAVREWEWVDTNPVLKVKKPKEETKIVRFLTDEERKKLLEAAKMDSNPHIYLIILLAISTGMRLGEITTLKWEQVDFEKERITLYRTKNKEIRVVPLVGKAKKELKEFFEKNKIKEFDIFFSKKSKKSIGHPKSAWKRVLKRAGIKNLRFHDLRHEFCSQLAMNGATLGEIAAAAGHKSLSMVKRYSHLSESHVSEVVERMNQKILGE